MHSERVLQDRKIPEEFYRAGAQCAQIKLKWSGEFTYTNLSMHSLN